jgi:hypothetical protein
MNQATHFKDVKDEKEEVKDKERIGPQISWRKEGDCLPNFA